MSAVKPWERQAEKTWCPGCGNYRILDALCSALMGLRIEPWKVVLVSGIGQAGKMPHYVGSNFLHGLHGRVLVHALGVKLANPELVVIAVGGDGDIYGEGAGHLVHCLRRNPDICCLVHNNGVYGLTKGQASPTSSPGFRTRLNPSGTAAPSLNPIALGLAGGGTFIGRGYAGEEKRLSRLIGEAIRHNGFGFIDILQPCVTYNRENTYQWYEERVYDLKAEGHDPRDFNQALDRALEWPDQGEERIPIGLFYQTQRKTYEEQLPGLSKGSLVRQTRNLELVARQMEGFR